MFHRTVISTIFNLLIYSAHRLTISKRLIKNRKFNGYVMKDAIAWKPRTATVAKTLLISVLVSVECHLTHLLSEKYLENGSSEGCCRLRRTLRTALPPYAKLQFCQRHSLESLLNARRRASVYAMYANRVNRKKNSIIPFGRIRKTFGSPKITTSNLDSCVTRPTRRQTERFPLTRVIYDNYAKKEGLNSNFIELRIGYRGEDAE